MSTLTAFAHTYESGVEGHSEATIALKIDATYHPDYTLNGEKEQLIHNKIEKHPTTGEALGGYYPIIGGLILLLAGIIKKKQKGRMIS